MPDPRPSDIPHMLRQAWILWISLFGGGAALFGVTAVVSEMNGGGVLAGAGESLDDLEPSSREGGLDREAADLIGVILGSVAIVALGLAFVVPSMLRRRPALEAEAEESDEMRTRGEVLHRLREFRSRSLIGWALSQGGANLASITLLLTGHDPLLVTAILLFAVHMAMTAPTMTRVRDWVAEHMSVRGADLGEIDGLFRRV